jgi:ribosome-associated protein
MEEPDFDAPKAPSKSQRKRDVHELQKLGEELLTFPDAILGELGLPETLLEALASARRITAHGARRRQLQYIGKLMRGIDTASIRSAVNARQRQQTLHSHAFHRLEKLRDALLTEPDTTLDTVLKAFPGADRHELHRLTRQARFERDNHLPPRTARALFRYLRDLEEQSD